MKSPTIAIRLPNWVGDGALAVPVVRSVQRMRASEPLMLVGTDRSLPLFGRWPGVTLLNAQGKGLRDQVRLAGLLRAASVREALILSPSFRSALPFFLAGIPKRIGFATDGRRLLLTEPVGPPSRHEALARQFLGLAERIGADPDEPCDPIVPIGTDEIAAAHRWLAKLGLQADRTIALCPGATYGETKRWPERHWIALGRSLLEEGWSFVLVGGDQERDAADRIARGIGRMARSLAGAIGLRESLALLSTLVASVSNDSGAMHLSAAADCPVIGLFGSTNPQWTGPMGHRSHVVHLGLPCSPCYAQTCPTEIECLVGLTPERIAAEVRNLMARPGGVG